MHRRHMWGPKGQLEGIGLPISTSGYSPGIKHLYPSCWLSTLLFLIQFRASSGAKSLRAWAPALERDALVCIMYALLCGLLVPSRVVFLVIHLSNLTLCRSPPKREVKYSII